MVRILRYIKARLLEGTTYAGIVTAIAGGNGLPEPYNHIAIVAGILAAVLPSPKVKGDA